MFCLWRPVAGLCGSAHAGIRVNTCVKSALKCREETPADHGGERADSFSNPKIPVQICPIGT